MNVVTTNNTITSTAASAIALGCFQDEVISGDAEQLDQATGGALTRLVESEEFTGKPLESVTLYAPHGMKATRVVLVGLGPRDEYSEKLAMRAAASASMTMADKKQKQVAYYFPAEQTSAAVCGAIVGCVGQDLYRKEPNQFTPESIEWANAPDSAAVELGNTLGQSINLTRELVNRPASDIYPESFASRCESLANSGSLSCEVWDRKRLEKEKCGALLAVSRASAKEPRLVILEHRGGGENDAPLALVGKGVTFDSGGLSLKPTDGMKEMKCDMAGAATVVGAMKAISAQNLPVNVIGLVGLVENMVDGSAYKLGDVLTARNGKTIEVLNTDAEGRLVLADVLDVAVERGADRIIDLATLTGACLVALGMDVAGVMSNDDGFQNELLDAARQTGEDAWPLPMFKEFSEQIKSEVADIKNVGNGRWGGAITAAKFLEEFVGETPWVHIDIAGPAFADSAKPYIAGGASGAFVRTLFEFAKRRSVGNA